MRSFTFGLGLLMLGFAVFACSSAEPAKKKIACKSTEECLPGDDGDPAPEGDQAGDRTVNGGSALTPTPASPSKDAGAPAPQPPCEQLAKCCDTITAYGDKISCVGIAVSKVDASCSPALSLCKAGGAGITDLAAGKTALGESCAKLASCCAELGAAGYDTTMCEGSVRGADPSVCRTRYESYQSFGDCR
jgi:hypothetical protein